uniref:Dynein light chain n=1 Tax=Peromyscus maniculatus bairdii TaxID=230844 RepID=A0A8C8UGK3_PERMB
MLLTRFEQKNGHLTRVEVDEVFGFMCHITTEVPPHNAVPGGVVLLVKLLLDMGRNILLHVVLLQRLGRALHRVLLHLFRHVCISDHRLPVAHGGREAGASRLLRAPREGAGAAQAADKSRSLPKPRHISKMESFFQCIFLAPLSKLRCP